MARPTSWVRREHHDLSGGPDFAAPLVDVGEGVTVARVRLTCQMTHTTDTFPGDWSPYPLVWGLSTTDGSATEPDLDVFNDSNNADWMWWEGVAWRTHFLGEVDPPDFELVSAPLDGGVRDIKAQRGPATSAGLQVWFQWRWIQPAAGDLFAFTMVTSSTLVILPE